MGQDNNVHRCKNSSQPMKLRRKPVMFDQAKRRRLSD